MEMKHTSGEWGVERPKSSEGFVVGFQIALVDKSQPGGFGGRIGEAYRNCLVTTEAEAEANARVFAAAPDLLVALTRLLDDGDPDLTMQGRRNLARAAIAKATGAQP